MSEPRRQHVFGAVRASERDRFVFFFLLAAVITLAETVGLAGAEALFLTRLGAGALPGTFVLASAVTVVGSLGYAVVVGRSRNDVLLSILLVMMAVAVGLGAFAAWSGIDRVLPGLLCAWFLSQAIFLNHFWTFAGDFFDTLATKRLFPLFTLGASLGGFCGGLLAVGIGALAPAETLVATWAAMLLVAALLVRAARSRLRRWGPLELEEEDETSVEGIRGALRHMRRSPLGRWLALSTVAMVTSLLVVQFLYSDVLATVFSNAEELALFIAVFLCISNLIEIGVELWITPWLIARLGVGNANLLHPVGTLISFGALAVHPALAAALIARANRELLENAAANPIRNLVYNALPARLRGRMRAFLEGIVMYSGMSLAGGALLALGAAPPLLLLCAVGGGLAGLYLLANVKVRSAYMRTLVDALRSGRVDLAEVREGVSGIGAARLEELWAALVAEGSRAPPHLLEQLAPLLVAGDLTDPVVAGLGHPDVGVRRVCVEALAPVERPAPRVALVGALHDSDSGVRRAALRALRPEDIDLASVSDALDVHLSDPDPQVRAEAALRRGEPGRDVLREMATSEQPADACAALAVLPRELTPCAAARSDDPNTLVRAAALTRLAELGDSSAVSLAALTRDLAAGEVEVRRAALKALAARSDAEALDALAGGLGDPVPDLRDLSRATLAARGAEALPRLAPLLRSDRQRVSEGALRTVAAAGLPDGRGILVGEFRHHARQGWVVLLSRLVLADDGTLATRFLRVALADAAVRHQRLAFVVLALLENPTVVRSVEKALRFGNARSRGDALEVLSHLGDREAARQLVLLLEAGSLVDKLPMIRSAITPPRDTPGVFAEASASGDRWLAAAAEARQGESAILSEEAMEHLLALGRVPLFSRLSLEQLEAVNRITREVVYEQDEVILREGEPGAELYLIVEGEVDVVNNFGEGEREIWLNRLGAGSYFGEMAILDGAPRSASIVARRDVRLLLLEGTRLMELILEMPEISFEILRVLTARLRASDRRVQDMVAEEVGAPGES